MMLTPGKTKTEKLGEKVKSIVDWQFEGATNLLPEAYKNSLNMIADQTLQTCKEAGLKFVERRWNEEGSYSHNIIEGIESG